MKNQCVVFRFSISFRCGTWLSFRWIVRMKPLSDFFFEPNVKDMGPDMVSLCVLLCRYFESLYVLSHEFVEILIFHSNRSVFVLFTCHRRPPFLNRSRSPVPLRWIQKMETFESYCGLLVNNITHCVWLFIYIYFMLLILKFLQVAYKAMFTW